jgi:hypothetical protein
MRFTSPLRFTFIDFGDEQNSPSRLFSFLDEEGVKMTEGVRLVCAAGLSFSFLSLRKKAGEFSASADMQAELGFRWRR